MKAKAAKSQTLYVYKDGEGLPDSQCKALDLALEKGEAEYQARPIQRCPINTVEAATIHVGNTEILYIGRPLPGRAPPCHWRAVTRFDNKRLGQQDYVEARNIPTDLGAPVLAALECAMGRDGLSMYNLDELKSKATAVEPEGVCVMTIQSGSRHYYVKHHGLWFGCFIIRKTEPPPNHERDVPGGQAYKPIAIA